MWKNTEASVFRMSIVTRIMFVLLIGTVVTTYVTISRLQTRVDQIQKETALALDYQSKKIQFIRKHGSNLEQRGISRMEGYEILAVVYDIAVEKYRLRSDLVLSLIEVESTFNKNAVSYMGAEGLMQIMPATGELISRGMGRPYYDLKDIRDNIEFGCYWLSLLMSDNKEHVALAMYNGGNSWQHCMGYSVDVLRGAKKWQ